MEISLVVTTFLATLALVGTILSSIGAYLTYQYMQAAKKTADDMRAAFNASADAQEALMVQVQDIQTRLSFK